MSISPFIYIISIVISSSTQLLHCDEVIVLLATLHEQILAVDEVVGSNHLVERAELLLVERYAATLHELAHLALRVEDLHVVACEEVYSRLSELILRQLEMGYAFEDREQCSLIELLESLLCALAEEDVRSLLSGLEVLT